MFRLSNTKSLTTTPYIVCFGYLVSPVYKTAQARQARARGPHGVKEGPFREVSLAPMGDGLREHGKLGGFVFKGGLY